MASVGGSSTLPVAARGENDSGMDPDVLTYLSLFFQILLNLSFSPCWCVGRQDNPNWWWLLLGLVVLAMVVTGGRC